MKIHTYPVCCSNIHQYYNSDFAVVYVLHNYHLTPYIQNRMTMSNHLSNENLMVYLYNNCRLVLLHQMDTFFHNDLQNNHIQNRMTNYSQLNRTMMNLQALNDNMIRYDFRNHYYMTMNMSSCRSS